MPAPEAANIYGVQIRESANDGSDFSNAASDYRILFLGEDGLLHVKDSAGTVTGPYTGGAPGLVALEQHTASASATLDFTSISSTYNAYRFEFEDIIPATNGAMFGIRAGTGAGPTYDTGSNYLSGFRYKLIGATTAGATWGKTTTRLDLHDDTAGSSLLSTGAPALQGHAYMRNPNNSSGKKMFEWQVVVQYSGDSNFYGVVGEGIYNSNTAVTAVRFLMSSGNITSGTVRMYGIAKS